LLRTAALILYPLLIHLMLSLEQERIAGACLVAVGMFPVVGDFLGRRGLSPSRLPFLGLASAGIFFLAYPHGDRLLFLPPVIVTLLVLGWFGASLLPGRTPLITQISRSIRGYCDPEVDHYTRRVTQMWTGVLTFLAIEVICLSLFASLPVWSLVTGLLNHLLVIGVFLGEYLFRIHHLRSHPHPGLGGLLRGMARLDWADLRP